MAKEIEGIEIPEQVKKDAWVAAYALELVTQCHFALDDAISNGRCALEELFDGDVNEAPSPSEAVDNEIEEMRSSC